MLYNPLKSLKESLLQILVFLLLILALLYYLFGSIRFKDYGDFVIRLIDVLAWPAVILTLASWFYDPIVKVLNSLADFLRNRTKGEVSEEREEK